MQLESVANVAVCGKFHYLNYVPQLAGEGVINRFYYSHKPSTGREIPKRIRRNFPLKELLVQSHLHLFGNKDIERWYPVYGSFWESQVLKNWKSASILHFLANGSSSRILERTRRDGGFILAEVVNTNPAARYELLREEARRLGVPFMKKQLLEREKRTLKEVEAAHAILAPTDIVAQSFQQRGFRGSVYKIPYAANLSRFSPRQYPDRTHSLNLICVGEIGLRKGQIHLLEAVKRLRSSAVRVTLVGRVSVGFEEMLAPYEGLFQHRLTVPSSEMPELLASHDVFVLPSLEEGLAVSICEAMATGLAVITTREAGGGELIQDGDDGILVDAGRPEPITEALQRLLDNREEVRALGEKAAKKMAEEYNWEVYADKVKSVYQSITSPLSGGGLA